MIAAHGYDNDLWDPSGTAGNQVMHQLFTEAMNARGMDRYVEARLLE